MNSYLYFNEKILDNQPLEFIEYGPLYNPIKSQKIELIGNTRFELITQYQKGAVSDSVDFPVGEIRQNNDTVMLKGRYVDLKVKLIGISPYHRFESYNHEEQTCIFTEKSEFRQLYIYYSDQHLNDIQIEYISNTDADYHLPDLFKMKTTQIINYTVNQLRINQTMLDIEHNSATALEMIIHDIKLYFIRLKKNESINDAVIIYEKVQSEEVRRKIRDCLSFCLGRQLQYIGYLIIDNENRPIECFYQINESNINFDSDSYVALMPAPLYHPNRNIIDKDKINKLTNALFNAYDKYNLKNVLWIYFNALYAPRHFAAAHFGACIESFQSAYLAAHPDDFPYKLIEKHEWRKLQNKLIQVLNDTNICDPELSILKNKINQLNNTPKSELTKRFFEHININLNTLESSAWKERNNAAHGKHSEKIVIQIKNIYILRCLFHRMVLKATKGSDFYFDYFSIGCPVKEVRTSIGVED